MIALLSEAKDLDDEQGVCRGLLVDEASDEDLSCGWIRHASEPEANLLGPRIR
jgi:hypothetical protein